MCLATAATIAAAASGVMSAAGTIMSGNAARGAANYSAAQSEQQAGQEVAVSQRKAIEARRQAGLANSRVTAVAAGSGASATDPTVLDIMGDNAGVGEFNALSALYSGEETARGLRMRGVADRYEGATTRQASLVKAGGTVLSAGSSLYDKYSMGGPADTGSVPSAFDNGSYGPSTLPWQNTPGYQMPRYS